MDLLTKVFYDSSMLCCKLLTYLTRCDSGYRKYQAIWPGNTAALGPTGASDTTKIDHVTRDVLLCPHLGKEVYYHRFARGRLKACVMYANRELHTALVEQ